MNTLAEQAIKNEIIPREKEIGQLRQTIGLSGQTIKNAETKIARLQAEVEQLEDALKKLNP